MKFKGVFSTITRLVTVPKEARKYLIYSVIIVAILGIIGVAIQNNLNGKLEKEKADLEQLNEERATANAELNAQVMDLEFLTSKTLAEIATLREEELVSLDNLIRYGGQLADSRIETKVLESQLKEAHEEIAGDRLKNSFLGARITQDLQSYFPEVGHLFFSETQDNLFRTNPATANAIYAIITENAVRIQLIGTLGGQITVIEEQVESMEGIIDLKDEEILAYMNLTDEFNDTFDNLEAALALERRTTDNLGRQIAIMNRKNLFERILPSLNVVIGPYYDPFNNRGGFAIALGLGWRF